MEQEQEQEQDQGAVKLGRGTPESAAWFREQLAELGLSQAALARELAGRGDDRVFDTILRTLRRMAGGGARVSGEMRGFLGLLKDHQELKLQMEQLKAGKMHTGDATPSGDVDTTEQTVGRVQRSQDEVRQALRILADHVG